jgi:hypothetical protein
MRSSSRHPLLGSGRQCREYAADLPPPDPRNLSNMAGPTDMSELHLALDRLRPQLCHCGLKGECLGCKGIEMVRAQAEAVVAAASQPILIQVAQESSMKDMTARFQAMSERLMADPDIRRSAEQMQERLMADPDTRQLLEELMRRLGNPPEETPN